MGVSFTEFFNNFLGDAPNLALLGDNELTLDFIDMVKEVIDDLIEAPNVIWTTVGDDAPVGDDSWEVTDGPTKDYGAKVVFLPSNLSNEEFLHQVPDTVDRGGVTKGLMYRSTFEPSIRDYITWNSKVFNCTFVNKIAPVNDTIIYLLEFKV